MSNIPSPWAAPAVNPAVAEPPAPAYDERGLLPLDPAQRKVWTTRAILNALALLAMLLFAGVPLLATLQLPPGLLFLIVLPLLFANVLVTPRRRYRVWGYRLDADELHVEHGLWTRVNTIVPLGRVQHIDVSQNPIERRYGLGRLIVHTAGTRSSDVELPGLPYGTAETLRDTIRAHIRQEPA